MRTNETMNTSAASTQATTSPASATTAAPAKFPGINPRRISKLFKSSRFFKEVSIGTLSEVSNDGALEEEFHEFGVLNIVNLVCEEYNFAEQKWKGKEHRTSVLLTFRSESGNHIGAVLHGEPTPSESLECFIKALRNARDLGLGGQSLLITVGWSVQFPQHTPPRRPFIRRRSK